MVDFQRFIEAQAPVYSAVLAELRAGRKRSHWMWYIFPQLDGLGRSDMARRYALTGLADAQAYLAHPLLGERLRECSRLAGAIEGGSAQVVFGSPDDLKFRSSMTLFALGAPEEAVFQDCLLKYFGGQGDPITKARL